MAVHKAADGLGGDQHHDDGDRDGGDHHGYLVDHAGGGYHRIQRENHVEYNDLDQDATERRPDLGAAVPLLAFEVLVDLVGALAEQEEPAEYQAQVAPRDHLPQHHEERRGEPYDPAQRQEQQDAHDQRPPKPQTPNKGLPRLGQPVHEDGDKDDVVYPQHDLQGQQRKKAIQILRSRNHSMTQASPIAAPNNLVTSYTL